MKINKPQYIDGVAYFCTKSQFQILTKTMDTFRKFVPSIKGYEHMYDMWKNNMKAVIVLQEDGYENGIYADMGVYILKKIMFENEDHVYIASNFFHESRHIEQYLKDNTLFSEENFMDNVEWTEEDAYKAQRAFLEWVGDENDLKDLDEDFSSKWWLKAGDDSDGLDSLSISTDEHERWMEIVDAHLEYLDNLPPKK